ncbi:MAG: AraC family transcriptional regulator ligand-binding domain-containing protein [Polyangiales bacterium]
MPAFVTQGFWDELERRGVPTRELERRGGMVRPQRGDVGSTVSLSTLHRVFEVASELTQDARIGLSVGRAIGIASFGYLGQLALASASLEQALELGARVYPHFPLRVPRLESRPDARMRLGLPRSASQVEADLIAVLMYDISRFFLDPTFGAPDVELPYAAPSQLETHRKFFEGALHFDGDGSYSVFPRAALLQRRSGADEELPKQLLALAQHRFRQTDDGVDWTTRVQRLLDAHASPRAVQAKDVALQLGVSPRGLTRRLASEGSTLSTLIDAAAFARAKQLLGRGMPAVHVAEQLGFSDCSAFFRAFRRWSGGLTTKEFLRAT